MLSDNDDDESAIKKSGQVLTNWISGSVVMYERRGKRDVVLLAGHFTIQDTSHILRFKRDRELSEYKQNKQNKRFYLKIFQLLFFN